MAGPAWPARAQALQGGQRVAGVHVHAVHGDPVPSGVVDQAVRGVEPHRLVAQQRGGERGRVVPLQPRAGVDQVGEADRVRLGEPVVGEGQDLGVDVLAPPRGRCRAPPSRRAAAASAPRSRSGARLALIAWRSRSASSGREPGAVDGQLHHLLLEQRHAQRLAQRRAHRLVRHGRVLEAVVAAQVRMHRTALDRARPDQRDLDDQVVELLRAQPRQGGHLRPGLHLEHAHRVRLASIW